MPVKTEKSKVLNAFKACFKALTIENEPVANIIVGNVQLYVLSHIPDNFQGVVECVPKSLRVDFLTYISKENSIKLVGRKQS